MHESLIVAAAGPVLLEEPNTLQHVFLGLLTEAVQIRQAANRRRLLQLFERRDAEHLPDLPHLLGTEALDT